MTIKSKKWTIERIQTQGSKHYFWSNVNFFLDLNPIIYCWDWKLKLDKDGYGRFKKTGAHRIAWELANNEELVKGDVVMHTCDNPACCNPNHLVKGTAKNNSQDRDFKLRSAAGIKNGRAKLNNQQVIDIYLDTRPKREIAKIYGLDESTVRGIKTGKTWSWLTTNIPKFN